MVTATMAIAMVTMAMMMAMGWKWRMLQKMNSGRVSSVTEVIPVTEIASLSLLLWYGYHRCETWLNGMSNETRYQHISSLDTNEHPNKTKGRNPNFQPSTGCRTWIEHPRRCLCQICDERCVNILCLNICYPWCLFSQVVKAGESRESLWESCDFGASKSTKFNRKHFLSLW